MASDWLRDDGTVVCPACGVIHEEASRLLVSLREDVENLERELRGKRGQIKRLRKEQDEAMTASPQYPDALAVLEHWREVCAPKARELRGERMVAVIARLNHYSPEQLIEAIDGYAAFPYVVNGRRSTTGRPSQWYAEAELIFRKPEKVDQGIRLAKEASAVPLTHSEAVPATVSEAGLSEMGIAALRLAEYGWLIFPVHPNAKTPATRNGLHDATQDTARIARFWREHPTFNIGVRCGQESGIVVLDVDGEEGMESLHGLERCHGALPTTASVVTPRGGQHFYFRHPGVEIRNTAGFPAPGLDIRGDGGYVLAPPSVGANDRRYEPDERCSAVDLPLWLKDALLKRVATQGTSVDSAEWERLITKGAREGERNSSLLRLAGHLFNRLAPGEVLGILKAVNGQHNKPPLSDSEIEKIVSSVTRMRAREALREDRNQGEPPTQ